VKPVFDSRREPFIELLVIEIAEPLSSLLGSGK
jgi:hypothetical protein